MATSRQIHRRRFLRAAATAAAACSIPSCARVGGPPVFLSESEARTLDAVCERLIPQDQDSGASKAGVVRFIDIQLAGHNRSFRELYRRGIRALDETSRRLHQRPFVDLDAERQDAVLGNVEKGEAPAEAWQEVSQKEFFNVVLDHAMQGFYGDPRHGGNAGGASWRMLGIPYPPVRGRDGYEFG
jgi:gluconate 2-dehydrogenase gamma chain